MHAIPGRQSLYAVHSSSSFFVPAVSQSLSFPAESHTHVLLAPHEAAGFFGSHGCEHTLPFGTAAPAT